MRVIALAAQRCTLIYAEAVLLVGDDQRKAGKINIVLYQRMSADNYINSAAH